MTSAASDGGKKHLGAAAITGCDVPPVHEFAGHDFDAIAAFVDALVVFDLYLALLSAGDAGAYIQMTGDYPDFLQSTSTLSKAMPYY